jgi:hypothetical protein
LPSACLIALVLLSGADDSGAAASVAFDLRALPADVYHQIDGLGLERKVALRLVQEGFAVMAPGNGADVEVRASMTDGGDMVLSAGARGDGAPPLRSTIPAAKGPAAEWHLEVAHKVSEMGRVLAATARRARAQAAAEAARAAAAPPLAPGPPPPPIAAAPAAPVPRAAPAATARAAPAQSAPAKAPPAAEAPWEVGLGAGALWRSGGSDPLAGVLATHARGRLRLHVDVLGARSSGSGVDVWEIQGAAGVGAAVIDGPASVDVGLAAGVVAQRYSLASAWATDRAGTHATPGVWLPVRARWAAGRLVVAARAAVGLARALGHTSEGATLWSRGSLRLEAMAVLAWTF